MTDDLVEEHLKIIRGYYLTALGQEPLVYYFKIASSQPEYEMIKAGDLALTFYQNREAITSIPALIRVDKVIDANNQVLEFLRSEQKDHLPMLPIVEIYEAFDPLRFKQLMETFEKLKADIKRLANITYIQGDLFDFLDEEDEDD